MNLDTYSFLPNPNGPFSFPSSPLYLLTSVCLLGARVEISIFAHYHCCSLSSLNCSLLTKIYWYNKKSYIDLQRYSIKKLLEGEQYPTPYIPTVRYGTSRPSFSSWWTLQASVMLTDHPFNWCSLTTHSISFVSLVDQYPHSFSPKIKQLLILFLLTSVPTCVIGQSPGKSTPWSRSCQAFFHWFFVLFALWSIFCPSSWSIVSDSYCIITPFFDLPCAYPCTELLETFVTSLLGLTVAWSGGLSHLTPKYVVRNLRSINCPSHTWSAPAMEPQIWCSMCSNETRVPVLLLLEACSWQGLEITWPTLSLWVSKIGGGRTDHLFELKASQKEKWQAFLKHPSINQPFTRPFPRSLYIPNWLWNWSTSKAGLFIASSISLLVFLFLLALPSQADHLIYYPRISTLL